MMAPLQRRVSLMLSRAVVRLVDDSLKLQGLQLQVLAGETLGNVERFQEYGITSIPHVGAEAVLGCINGNRSHGVVIAVDDRRYRLTDLLAGEVALYTDEDKSGGLRIHLKRNKEIHLIAGGSSIVMTPAGITLTAPSVDFVKS